MHCGCSVKVSISVVISFGSPFHLLAAISSSVLVLFFSWSLLFQGNRSVFCSSALRQENGWDVGELFEQ